MCANKRRGASRKRGANTQAKQRFPRRSLKRGHKLGEITQLRSHFTFHQHSSEFLAVAGLFDWGMGSVLRLL